jgi:hypothetical protein
VEELDGHPGNAFVGLSHGAMVPIGFRPCAICV